MTRFLHALPGAQAVQASDLRDDLQVLPGKVVAAGRVSRPQVQSLHRSGMLVGKTGCHRAAQRVPADGPVLDFRVGSDHFLGAFGAKHRQVERHGHDDGQVPLTGDLMSYGCIRTRVDPPARVNDQAGIGLRSSRLEGNPAVLGHLYLAVRLHGLQRLRHGAERVAGPDHKANHSYE